VTSKSGYWFSGGGGGGGGMKVTEVYFISGGGIYLGLDHIKASLLFGALCNVGITTANKSRSRTY